MSQFRIFAMITGISLIAACSTVPSAEPEITTNAKPKKPAAPVFMLDDLLGVNGKNIDAMLGAPALTRREGDGEFRRYALKTCTLVVILYPDELGFPKVEHVDATAHESGEEKPDLDDCLAAG